LKLVNYISCTHPDEPPRTGVFVPQGIIDIKQICHTMGYECPCGNSLIQLLGCPDCLAIVRQAASEAEPQFSLSDVKLLPPVLHRGKLLCVADNYGAHIRESGSDVQPADKATPRFFLKPVSNTLCGPDEPIWLSRTAQFVDYEGELAVIICKRGKYIKAADALSYVGGATGFNDVSERRLKIWERPKAREGDDFFDWLNGKWGDHFAPLGPCVVPLEDLGDLQNLFLQTRVNGEIRQQASTAEMIFSVPELIEYISHILTLEPGDIIATGTPAGVGKYQGMALKPGDIVEIEISGIGVLRNPVRQEP